MADKLMVHIDSMATQQSTMEKKLEKERHKAQRYSQIKHNYKTCFRVDMETK